MLFWTTLRLGWGCISSGAGTASAISASEWPLCPKHLPFPPPACSTDVLTPHNASLNDPEAGLGLHLLGEWVQQWLAWKLKVGRSNWFLIIHLFINNYCFGPKLEPNGQIMVKIVRYGGTVLVRSDTVVLADRNLDRTVRSNYGRYHNYGTKSNITRKCTDLTETFIWSKCYRCNMIWAHSVLLPLMLSRCKAHRMKASAKKAFLPCRLKSLAASILIACFRARPRLLRNIGRAKIVMPPLQACSRTVWSKRSSRTGRQVAAMIREYTCTLCVWVLKKYSFRRFLVSKMRVLSLKNNKWCLIVGAGPQLAQLVLLWHGRPRRLFVAWATFQVSVTN